MLKMLVTIAPTLIRLHFVLQTSASVRGTRVHIQNLNTGMLSSAFSTLQLGAQTLDFHF